MDALEDYISEEDEDYVPGDEDDGDYHSNQSTGQRATKGKGTKRKRAAGSIELLAPKRVPLNTKAARKKGVTRIGAAVLSDDDDDTQLPLDEQAVDGMKEGTALQRVDVQNEERKEDEAAAKGDVNSVVEEKQLEDGSHSAGNGAGGAAAAGVAQIQDLTGSSVPHPSGAVPLNVSSSTLPPTPAATTPTASTTTASASSARPSPTAPPTSSTSAAAAKGGDMASILAQFNKKPTAKPAIKKVINPWEIPTKPKSATPASTSTPAATPPTSSITVPSPSIPPPAASLPSALSTEQVIVSDITSYAGETIQVTKTLIRGSAEELAHRASTANNLTTLLSSLTNQRTINTLEKSRLDWSVSKDEEGDGDELRRFVGSKEGLVDRMAFLARAEKREWEKVKAVRDESKRQTMTASTEGMEGD